MVVSPPWDAFWLTFGLWSGLAGVAARMAMLGGDDWSAGFLQLGASVAALVGASLVGVPMLLRPMAVRQSGSAYSRPKI